MAELYHTEEAPQLICWDRRNYQNFDDQLAALKKSRTVYVGNLSFFSSEQQIYETFNTVGPVKRLIMGVNMIHKTPCGFCFIEYYNQDHAYAALKYVNDTVCDDRVIRCDADGGFLPGRQFGRGKTGGQIRDERRTDYDPARGRFVPPEIVMGQSTGMSGGEGRKRGRDDDMEVEDRQVKYNRERDQDRRNGGGGRGRGGGYRHDDRRDDRRDDDRRGYGRGDRRPYFQHDERGSRREREVVVKHDE